VSYTVKAEPDEDGASYDGSVTPTDKSSTPVKKKQKRNKPTLSCHECVERKTKVRSPVSVSCCICPRPVFMSCFPNAAFRPITVISNAVRVGAAADATATTPRWMLHELARRVTTGRPSV
jgi:hypothetical protein